MLSGYEYLHTFHKTLSNVYESFDIGCSRKSMARIKKNCDDSIFVDTFVVKNPRDEYIQNLYHSMEEVFSLYQTARMSPAPRL